MILASMHNLDGKTARDENVSSKRCAKRQKNLKTHTNDLIRKTYKITYQHEVKDGKR